MGDWPEAITFNRYGGGVLSTATELGGSFFVTPTASTAWPLANLAIFCPIRAPLPVTIYKLTIGAGATATGNFDVGVYDSAGNRLVSSGSTPKSANVEQIIDVTDTRIGPGLYYLALSADGTINFGMRAAAGTTPVPSQKIRLLGIMEMTSAFPLPAVATYAASTNAIVVAHISAHLRSN